MYKLSRVITFLSRIKPGAQEKLHSSWRGIKKPTGQKCIIGKNEDTKKQLVVGEVKGIGLSGLTQLAWGKRKIG